MKPPPFRYHRPTAADDVVALLAELGDDAKVLAGGQSLVPMLNLRLARFDHLIDIGRIAGLTAFEQRDGEFFVGATVTGRTVELEPTVGAAVPLLRAVTPYVGHFQIRNRGTVGGSMAHADPAAEYPAVAVALGAHIELTSRRHPRRVPADQFFTGYWSTAMASDELLLGISFPMWGRRSGFGVAEFARRHGDFAIAGAVAAIEVDVRGTITRSALTAFGVGATPVTVATVTGASVDDVDADELSSRAIAELTDIADDPQVPAAYRRRVAGTVIADAWRQAVADLRDRTDEH